MKEQKTKFIEILAENNYLIAEASLRWFDKSEKAKKFIKKLDGYWNETTKLVNEKDQLIDPYNGKFEELLVVEDKMINLDRSRSKMILEWLKCCDIKIFGGKVSTYNPGIERVGGDGQLQLPKDK